MSPSPVAVTRRGHRRNRRRHRRNGSPPVKPASVLTLRNYTHCIHFVEITWQGFYLKFSYRTATHGKQSTHLAHNVHNLHINSDVSSASSMLSSASTVAVFNTTSGGQCTGVEAAILDSRRLYPSDSSASQASSPVLLIALALCSVVLVTTARQRWFYNNNSKMSHSDWATQFIAPSLGGDTVEKTNAPCSLICIARWRYRHPQFQPPRAGNEIPQENILKLLLFFLFSFSFFSFVY